MRSAWTRLIFDTTRLAIESHHVITLRLLKLSLGGRAAQSEALTMLTEKATASVEAMETFAFGGAPARVVQNYRRRVRANARRLSR